MDTYRSLLRAPGVARIMASQIVARFPSGMIALGLLIHIEQRFDSYGSAGLVLAMTSLGQAVAGPVTSRLMGRLGARPVLAGTTVLCAAALLVLALATMPLPAYMLVGLLCGLSFPPVQPAVRTMYPKIVEPARLPRLFSLDASAQEIIWVMGPMVITVLSLEVSSVLGLLACAVLVLLGGAWFISSPELGEVRFAPSGGRFGAVLMRGPVLLATASGFLLVGATGAIEAAVVSRFGEGGLRAGVILAAMSLASLVAGFAFGHRRAGRYTLTIWIATMFVGSVGAVLTDGFWGTLLTISVAGIGLAPALAVMSSMIAERVRFDESAEAYGWANTGQLVGVALGSASAGFLIDSMGSDGGFLTGAAFGLAGVVFTALTVRVREVRRRARPR